MTTNTLSGMGRRVTRWLSVSSPHIPGAHPADKISSFERAYLFVADSGLPGSLGPAVASAFREGGTVNRIGHANRISVDTAAAFSPRSPVGLNAFESAAPGV